jgi:hypothetical protein
VRNRARGMPNWQGSRRGADSLLEMWHLMAVMCDVMYALTGARFVAVTGGGGCGGGVGCYGVRGLLFADRGGHWAGMHVWAVSLGVPASPI